MVRIIIDIQDTDDIFAAKELLAMALESLGRVRIVKITNGKQELNNYATP